MSQNDFVIASQSAPEFRSDLNTALQALASLSSGATAPSTTYANMLWYDTANNILKMRSEADDAWISIGYLDQTANAFRVLDDTQAVNTSGTQTGLIGDQATATWETGTSTTESLVSPAKVASAVDTLVDTTKVLTETAGASLGGVGTYAFLGSSGTTINPGDTISGSSLQYAGVTDNGFDTNQGQVELYTLSIDGTWRAMGWKRPYENGARPSATLFLRIS